MIPQNTDTSLKADCPSAPCSPLSAGELMRLAIEGKPIPADRALATFAQESNWVQIYHGETSPAVGYEAKACEWAFVGPSRPPYELAQWALKFLTENGQSAGTAETLRASRDTLFDLLPRKRSLSGMRDAVSKRLDELERQEANEEYPKDRMRKGRVQTSGEIVLWDNIDRLRTLLGKIEGAMAPAVANRAIFDKEAKPVVNKPLERAPAVPRPINMAGETRPVRTKTTAPAFDTLHPKAQEKFNAAFEARDVDKLKEYLHPSNKGLRAEFERRSGEKLPAGVGSTGKALEAWAAKGATSVVKAAEPEKAPELMTPSDFAKTAEFVKAKGTNSGLMVRIGNVMQTFNEQTRGKLTKPAAEILADVHKQIITGKFEMLRSDIADAHPQSVASTAGIARKRLSNPSVYSVSAPAVDAYGLKLPEGYVRDGDVYRYEQPSNPPTPATTPAEGQSTGGVVEGEKEGP